MKTIFINIQWKVDKLIYYLKESFLDIKEKYNLEIINFYIPWKIDSKEIEELKKEGINMIWYIDEKNLIDIIKDFDKNNSYKVNTFTEQLIPITNRIKKELWQKITKQPNLFRNKKLQRELLLKNKEIATKYKKVNINNLSFDNLKKEFNLPFVIKPSNWLQSSWVSIIKSKLDLDNYILNFEKLFWNMSKKFDMSNFELIIEEFIDWDKYSIDYFIDENWDITSFTYPIFVYSADYVWIDDLFEFVRIASIDIVNKLDLNKLYNFLKATIKITKIKNTFVHHEFKLTTIWKFKTIELNWRIWWYRLEMYKQSSNLNLLDLMFEKKIDIKIKTNFAVALIYSEKEWILKKYNKDIFLKLQELESFFSLNTFNNTNIWKKIWLTKNWYSKVAVVKFKNTDFKQLKKDVEFLKNHYKKLLILK